MILIEVLNIDYFNYKNCQTSQFSNNYIKCIKYLDEGPNEIIYKSVNTALRSTVFINNQYQLHNPIGPARIINYPSGAVKKEYWINGKRTKKDEHDTIA